MRVEESPGKFLPAGKVTRVTLDAPAKINLRLRIVGRRSDGYHLLDSLVLPVRLFDRLEICVVPSNLPAVDLVCHSPSVPRGNDNLAVRAALLFMTKTNLRAEVSIKLDKDIPIGAGLGGASSDAAAVLSALRVILQPRITPPELMNWALELGADVPFFIHGRPGRVRGIGERIDSLDSWPSSPLVIVFPGVSLSTAEVYRAYDNLLTKQVPDSSIRPPTPGQVPIRELLENDLEEAACQIYPGLRLLSRRLLDLGAEGVLMTGSGSAVFGLWERWEGAHVAAERIRADGLWARAVQILERVPEVIIQ